MSINFQNNPLIFQVSIGSYFAMHFIQLAARFMELGTSPPTMLTLRGLVFLKSGILCRSIFIEMRLCRFIQMV